jgi:hypothetical protein
VKFRTIILWLTLSFRCNRQQYCFAGFGSGGVPLYAVTLQTFSTLLWRELPAVKGVLLPFSTILFYSCEQGTIHTTAFTLSKSPLIDVSKEIGPDINVEGTMHLL